VGVITRSRIHSFIQRAQQISSNALSHSTLSLAAAALKNKKIRDKDNLNFMSATPSCSDGDDGDVPEPTGLAAKPATKLASGQCGQRRE
jgi:hypothetical protein